MLWSWRVHPSAKQCFTMITHMGQHTFNCTLIGFRNSPAYTKRQIDYILQDLRSSTRAYVDDIISASPSLDLHIRHLRQLFSRLVQYNIALKPEKCFIGYPSTTILGKHVNALGLLEEVEVKVESRC